MNMKKLAFIGFISMVFFTLLMYSATAQSFDDTAIRWYHSFDDDDISGGSMSDLSSNNLDGTYTGVLTGKTGVANLSEMFIYKGANDRAEITDHNDLDIGAGNFSITMWERSNYTGATQMFLFQKHTAGPDYIQIYSSTSDGGRIEFYFSETGSADVCRFWFNDATFSNNGFHVYTWIRNATTCDANGYHVLYDGNNKESLTFHATNNKEITSFTPNENLFLGTDSSLGSDFEGSYDDFFWYDRALNEDELDQIYNGGFGMDTAAIFGGGGAPPVADQRNVTFTAKSNYDHNTINTFNVTVNGGGTNGTTGGSIIIQLNTSKFYNITFHSPDHIINDSYTDLNISSDKTGYLHEAEVYISAIEYFQNFSINTFNTTLSTNTNSTAAGTTKHYLTANNYTIIGNASHYYTIEGASVEATKLSNSSETIEFYRILNISATSRTGTPIQNFTVSIVGATFSDSRVNNTNSYNLEYKVTNQTYNVTVNATGYALSYNSVLITINNTGNAYTNLNFVLYTSNSFDIQFLDEATGTLINGTLIELDLISDLYAANYSTTNGTLYIDLLTPTTYTFRYFASGYQPRLSTHTLNNNTYNRIDLYLLTGGSNVSLYVYDTAREPVENSTIKIHRYSTANNSYILINTLNTDFEGKAITNMQLNTEFYRFYIYYGGVLKHSTAPAYVTGTELVFTINLETPILESYFTTLDDYTFTLTFSPTTQNFKYYFDSIGEASQGCLYVYTITTLGETLHNSSCLAATTGTILLAGQNVSGTDYIAKAYVTVGGTDILLKQLTFSWIESTLTAINSDFGLFIIILITIIFALISIWSLPVSLILTPLPIVLGAAGGIINVPVGSAIGFFIICVILAGVVSRR